MELNCEGCAGCCLDWRPIAEEPSDHERRGPGEPLDDAYNFVPLTRDEVARFVERGLGDALRPRLWRVDEDTPGVVVDGVRLAAIAGRPAFFVGLAHVPKPVAPFGTERRWLETCAFLDPETLQCRIHGGDLYPDECATYPGRNLDLDVESECERVEAAFGGDRLLDDDPEDGAGPLLGPQAVGAKVFAYPDAEELSGVVDRLSNDGLTATDRAAFVGIAAGSRPGSLAVDEDRAAAATADVLDADSWVGRAVEAWADAASEVGARASDPPSADDVEVARGAPETPGWDAVGE
ncbi:YkgJ family cysteine cluster protein [Halobellus rubicundus]|uniref:YkgJ family cysteine cluster protein n=1 Tax=Halobellus rubicundus TaxID=2996466 RepID=A0ABD5M854_9EURY